MSRDPIEYEGSQWNLYEYVGGMPIDSTDPFGLRNFWNPFSWDQRSDPAQGWLGFFNPLGNEVTDSVVSGAESVGNSAISVGNAAVASAQDVGNFVSFGDPFGDSSGRWQTAYKLGPHGQLAAQIDAGLSMSEWFDDVAMGANVGGLGAAVGALGVGAWAAAGLPTYGVGVVTTSETSVFFQVNSQFYMGTNTAVYNVSNAAYAKFGYWTSLTGIPIINAEAAAAGAGTAPLWFPSQPCASQALQGFINGYKLFP